MPLAAADPRPRNPFGQFSPGAALSPDQMNRAYGIRTKVLASILSARPAMKNIPPLTAKDIARISGLAAKARSLVNLEKLDLGEKPIEPTPECGPCAAKPAKVWYPSIYIGSRTNAGDKLAQIPRKGKAVIEYRVRDITTTEDAEGKVTSSASLEVQSIDPVAADDGAQVAPVAGAEFAARLGRLIGFGRGDYAIAAMVRSGKLTAQEARTGYSRLLGRQSVMNTARGVAGAKLAAQRSHLAKTLIKDRTTLSALSTPVELTRGDYILPYLARSGKLEIRPMVGRAKLNMVNGYVSRTGVDIAAQAKNLANITAAAISRPKDYKRILNAELYAKPGHHTWIRGELARGFWNERAARTALSALSDRTVELAASVAGDKIPRPQFVEDGGFVKIVRPDGTASEIGRAPGMMNRIRRNKGKLIVGGLGAVAGAIAAKKVFGGKKAA